MFSSEEYLLSDWWRNICKYSIQKEHPRNFCTIWYLIILSLQPQWREFAIFQGMEKNENVTILFC